MPGQRVARGQTLALLTPSLGEGGSAFRMHPGGADTSIAAVEPSLFGTDGVVRHFMA